MHWHQLCKTIWLYVTSHNGACYTLTNGSWHKENITRWWVTGMHLYLILEWFKYKTTITKQCQSCQYLYQICVCVLRACVCVRVCVRVWVCVLLFSLKNIHTLSLSLRQAYELSLCSIFKYAAIVQWFDALAVIKCIFNLHIHINVYAYILGG